MGRDERMLRSMRASAYKFAPGGDRLPPHAYAYAYMIGRTAGGNKQIGLSLPTALVRLLQPGLSLFPFLPFPACFYFYCLGLVANPQI
jgi:hypothetical protein